MLVDLIIWSRNSFSSWRTLFTATWEKKLYLYKLECWPIIPECWDTASKRWGRDAKTKDKRDIDIVYWIWNKICHKNLDIEKIGLKHQTQAIKMGNYTKANAIMSQTSYLSHRSLAKVND